MLKEQLAKAQNDYDALVKNELPVVSKGLGKKYKEWVLE